MGPSGPDDETALVIGVTRLQSLVDILDAQQQQVRIVTVVLGVYSSGVRRSCESPMSEGRRVER